MHSFPVVAASAPTPVLKRVFLSRALGACLACIEIGTWWAVLWLLFGKTMLPGGTGFALAAVCVIADASGQALQRFVSSRLPQLLGMLWAGLALSSANPAGPAGPLGATDLLLGETFEWWSSKIRACALAVIMLRAGLGLNLAKLRSLGWVALRLSFLPCLAEALTIAALAGPLLELPAAWALAFGFLLAAISPSVTVPGMLSLQERGCAQRASNS
jgi:NhaP-type Na+/H+ or K+/H+ antiporter